MTPVLCLVKFHGLEQTDRQTDRQTRSSAQHVTSFRDFAPQNIHACGGPKVERLTYHHRP